MNIKQFKSRKEVSQFLKEKGIDTSQWSEEKWLSINKGQSEIHMMALAECMYDALNESTPKQLKAGEWHIPFGDNIDLSGFYDEITSGLDTDPDYNYWYNENLIKVATARCARVSYTVVGEEGKEHDYSKDIELHDRLLSSGHFSPFEHCARCMSDEEYNSYYKGNITHYFANDAEFPECVSMQFDDSMLGWCNNFRGFISYRYMIESN